MLKRFLTNLKQVLKLKRLQLNLWLVGLTETKILHLYQRLARLDYRDFRYFWLKDGLLFEVRTMKGGPTIRLPNGYVFILKLNQTTNQIYIQEADPTSLDGWSEVYRTGVGFRRGRWTRVLKSLTKEFPCRPEHGDGFL